MYYTVIKHDGHLTTRGKCKKHEPQASVFYISLVLSNARRVLSQCNTRLKENVFPSKISNIKKNDIDRIAMVLQRASLDCVMRETFTAKGRKRSSIYTIILNEIRTYWVAWCFLAMHFLSFFSFCLIFSLYFNLASFLISLWALKQTIIPV